MIVIYYNPVSSRLNLKIYGKNTGIMGRCEEAKPLWVFRGLLRQANTDVLNGKPKLASTLSSGGAELVLTNLLDEFPDANPTRVFEKAYRAANNSSRQLYARVMRKPQR